MLARSAVTRQPATPRPVYAAVVAALALGGVALADECAEYGHYQGVHYEGDVQLIGYDQHGHGIYVGWVESDNAFIGGTTIQLEVDCSTNGIRSIAFLS